MIAPELLEGIDIITSSHNHTDHLDAATLLPILARNPGARLVIPRANREFVLDRLGSVEDRLTLLDAGETVNVSTIQFTGIPAAHNAVERDDQGRCRFLGYVATAGALRIYHSGDTLMHGLLVAALAPCQVDVALLPINGNRPERKVAGNLDGVEAAHLAKAIGARVAIPHHFDTFEFNTASTEEFEAECCRVGQSFRVLRHGEGIDL